MARRVFFHIGVPKSGTTYLQTMTWKNRELLRARGFLYPGLNRFDHYHASRVVRGADPEELGEDADSWQRLVDELAAWDGDGLITHEFFSQAPGKRARMAMRQLRPAKVHLVLTARDYTRQFPAVWQEALKMKSDLSLDEFTAKAFAHELDGAWSWRSQDVAAILARWSRRLPPERVHVVTVPPPGAPRDLLWQRWCQVLDIDDTGFDPTVATENQSLGAAQAALLLRLKPLLSGQLLEGPVRHRWVRKYFGHQVLVPQNGERFGLRPEDYTRLREMSIRMTQQVADAGYDVVGDLADLVPPETAPDLAHPGDVSDAELVDVAARAIEQMIRDLQEVTEERDLWQSRALAPPTRRFSLFRRGGVRNDDDDEEPR